MMNETWLFFKKIVSFIVKNKQTKKILWLFDVCTWGCSLLYWLRGQSERTQDDRRKLAVWRESWRLLKNVDRLLIGNIYCMLSTGPHTWTNSTSVCVPEHAVRSACKGLETTELCFIVVGLLAHMYMRSLNPNSVVKTKKKEENLYQNVIWSEDGNFSSDVCFYTCPCKGTMGVFYIWASTDVDIVYSSNFVMLSQKKKTLPVEWTNIICAKWSWICIFDQPA